MRADLPVPLRPTMKRGWPESTVRERVVPVGPGTEKTVTHTPSLMAFDIGAGRALWKGAGRHASVRFQVHRSQPGMTGVGRKADFTERPLVGQVWVKSLVQRSGDSMDVPSHNALTSARQWPLGMAPRSTLIRTCCEAAPPERVAFTGEKGLAQVPTSDAPRHGLAGPALRDRPGLPLAGT